MFTQTSPDFQPVELPWNARGQEKSQDGFKADKSAVTVCCLVSMEQIARGKLIVATNPKTFTF